jgi:Terpene cyclase DEP1
MFGSLTVEAVETAEHTPSVIPVAGEVRCGVYGAIALAALVATWSQNVAYPGNRAGFVNFWQDTKVTAASRSITADIVMFALAATILMVIEARKYNVRFVWAYILGSALVAVSVTFPLFLIARELRLGASESPRLHVVDAILLGLFAILLVAFTVWVDVR